MKTNRDRNTNRALAARDLHNEAPHFAGRSARGARSWAKREHARAVRRAGRAICREVAS